MTEGCGMNPLRYLRDAFTYVRSAALRDGNARLEGSNSLVVSKHRQCGTESQWLRKHFDGNDGAALHGVYRNEKQVAERQLTRFINPHEPTRATTTFAGFQANNSTLASLARATRFQDDLGGLAHAFERIPLGNLRKRPHEVHQHGNVMLGHPRLLVLVQLAPRHCAGSFVCRVSATLSHFGLRICHKPRSFGKPSHCAYPATATSCFPDGRVMLFTRRPRQAIYPSAASSHFRSGINGSTTEFIFPSLASTCTR